MTHSENGLIRALKGTRNDLHEIYQLNVGSLFLIIGLLAAARFLTG